MPKNCFFCGGPVGIVLKFNNFSTKKCLRCKIALTSPAPSVPDYTQMDFHASSKEDLQTLTDIKSLPYDWQKLISIQSEMVKKNLPIGSRVLEIGCGEGLLLGELLKNNYLVYGIEPSQAAYKRILLRGSIEAKCGYFPQQQFSEPFDLIIMSHVLEHIENPEELLLNIKKSAPNGYFMVTQTNYLGLIPRVLKENWYAWVPDQHFWHFSLTGLTKYLAKFGFVKVSHQFSSLVHPHNKLYKIANTIPQLRDQFIAIYKINLCTSIK